MLSYELLPAHEGVRLIGDIGTLHELAKVVREVSMRAPNPREECTLLHLSNEIRHAYDGHRDVVEPPPTFPEMGVRFGVKLSWFELLVQTRVLRTSLAYVKHSKLHQAMAYALEDVVESALSEDFGEDAEGIIEAACLVNADDLTLQDRISEHAETYRAWSGLERRDGFRDSLAKLSAPWLKSA